MRKGDYIETLAFFVAGVALALGLICLADTADADWADGIEYGCFKQAPWEQETAPEAAEGDSEGRSEPEWEDWTSDEETGVTGDYGDWAWQADECDPETFRRMGVVESGGEVFTYYSERVLPGGGLTELNENGRHVDDDGLVRDADGYIAVASPWGRDEIGTVVETPLGMGKIYDTNEGDSYDLYVNWD